MTWWHAMTWWHDMMASWLDGIMTWWHEMKPSHYDTILIRFITFTSNRTYWAIPPQEPATWYELRLPSPSTTSTQYRVGDSTPSNYGRHKPRRYIEKQKQKQKTIKDTMRIKKMPPAPWVGGNTQQLREEALYAEPWKNSLLWIRILLQLLL